MELRSVVLKLFLKLLVTGTSRCAALASVLGCNNKAYLTTRVGRDSGVSILYALVFLADGVHEGADELAVKPHALSLGTDNTSISESIVHSVVEGSLE